MVPDSDPLARRPVRIESHYRMDVRGAGDELPIAIAVEHVHFIPATD